MFVTVRYGEKEEAIFNPQCKSITLMNNIKEKCQCEFDAELDLSDESGNVKNLRYIPYRYANEVLADREKLVLLRVDHPDSGDTQFVPLLNDNDAVNETFLSVLASKANLHRSAGKKGRSRGLTPTGKNQSRNRSEEKNGKKGGLNSSKHNGKNGSAKTK